MVGYKILIYRDFWLRGQDLKLRPSGYEPDITLGFLRITAAGRQKVAKISAWKKSRQKVAGRLLNFSR